MQEHSSVRRVRKRNGSIVDYDNSKIAEAIYKAAQSVGGSNKAESFRIAKIVEEELTLSDSNTHDVEEVQDTVERVLIKQGHAKTAKSYILHRARRAEVRDMESNKLDAKDPIALMFDHKPKMMKLVGEERIKAYKETYMELRRLQEEGKVPMHPTDDYLGGNELATNIYERKYYVKDLAGKPIEKRPEHVFTRLASYVATLEKDRIRWAKRFYEMLYEGYFVPGGRVIAGAGDLYRLKTLANCFVSLIHQDTMESIYKTAYNCARTYSYGGGIGVDISCLRPKDSVVHNAADKSTGSVSFMELYSLTTGLIGQSGRRGALMLTIDVKHPDVMDFVNVKKNPNWVTKQIVEQCRWSGRFDEADLQEIEKQVRENTQVRFANISMKVSDEFMHAVDEENKHGRDKLLVYRKDKSYDPLAEHEKISHYSYGMPSKDLSRYEFIDSFKNVRELNMFLKKYKLSLDQKELDDVSKRDMFADFVLKAEEHDLAIRKAGDYMLYFNSRETGEIKRLVRARKVWNTFVAGNYNTAEPGLIFWSTMKEYSPSNYVGRPIASTNPCGEVPLEDGGACNLGSINLSRFVTDGYSDDAKVDWDNLKEVTKDLVRFLDDVVSWNSFLNPLESQRKAATETRRTGLGIMGIADMLNQLGIGYDSEEGLELLERISRFIANASYESSAELAEEKGRSPIFDEGYFDNPFFREVLSDDVKALVKEKGLRNIAILSIAPTGTISNIVLGYKGEKNYIGVSGGIEPIFSLYYTRRSESFGNKLFKVFHATIQAYIDKKELNEQVDKVKGIGELQHILPAHFFRTAHFVSPQKRVKIQGLCQKYIDHSISSTVNLPESIDPEIISDIYLDAWKNGLKGITIYRDGSRYPILSVEQQQSEFQKFKDKKYRVTVGKESFIRKGDEVFEHEGRLTTVFHALRSGLDITVEETQDDVKVEGSEDAGSDKACKVEFKDGKLVKSCGD